MPLSSSVTTTLQFALTSASPGPGSGTADFTSTVTRVINLLTGTGAGQADKVWAQTRTVAASGTDAIDLAGVLVDALGAALTFVKVKAVLVNASSANTNNVRVNRPATNGLPLFNAASGGTDVQPGGTFLWASPTLAGIPVTPGTGDLLNLDNSGAGTSVTYDVVIIGTSA